MNRTVLYGPPGTGKSTYLINTMKEFMRQGTPQNRIGFTSFTKAAAQELASRVGIQSRMIGTVHSFAFRQAKIIMEQVMSGDRLREFSKEIGVPMTVLDNVEDAEESEIQEGDEYYALYNLYRVSGDTTLESVYIKSHRPGSMGKFMYFAESLEKYKTAHGYIDFNDMLERALSSPPLDLTVLMIDEAQDLSPLQWRLVNYWASHVEHVYVAGDDDQAIYVWGGADPLGMPRFEESTGARRIVLDQSRRVPKAVHTLAENVIKNVPHRVDKVYLPRADLGQVNEFYHVDDLTFKHGEDCMVLYRNHSMRAEYERLMFIKCLPYSVKTGAKGILDKWTGKAIKTWVRLGTGDSKLSDSELKNLLRNMSYEMIKLKDYNKDLNQVDCLVAMAKQFKWQRAIKCEDWARFYFEAVETKYGLDVKPTILFSSIHASKGCEADRVVLHLPMTVRTMEGYLKDPVPETRAYYVGVTRAKRQLDLVHGANEFDLTNEIERIN